MKLALYPGLKQSLISLNSFLMPARGRQGKREGGGRGRKGERERERGRLFIGTSWCFSGFCIKVILASLKEIEVLSIHHLFFRRPCVELVLIL